MTEISVRNAASPRSISSQTSASETKSSPAPPYSSGITLPSRPELGHALDHAHVEVVVDVVLDRVRQHALVHEGANGVLDQALLLGQVEFIGAESMGRREFDSATQLGTID